MLHPDWLRIIFLSKNLYYLFQLNREKISYGDIFGKINAKNKFRKDILFLTLDTFYIYCRKKKGNHVLLQYKTLLMIDNILFLSPKGNYFYNNF